MILKQGGILSPSLLSAFQLLFRKERQLIDVGPNFSTPFRRDEMNRFVRARKNNILRKRQSFRRADMQFQRFIIFHKRFLNSNIFLGHIQSHIGNLNFLLGELKVKVSLVHHAPGSAIRDLSCNFYGMVSSLIVFHGFALDGRYLGNLKGAGGVSGEAFEGIGQSHQNFELQKPFKLIGSIFFQFFKDIFGQFFGLSLTWSIVIGSAGGVAATVASPLHLFFTFCVVAIQGERGPTPYQLKDFPAAFLDECLDFLVEDGKVAKIIGEYLSISYFSLHGRYRCAVILDCFRAVAGKDVPALQSINEGLFDSSLPMFIDAPMVRGRIESFLGNHLDNRGGVLQQKLVIAGLQVRGVVFGGELIVGVEVQEGMVRLVSLYSFHMNYYYSQLCRTSIIRFSFLGGSGYGSEGEGGMGIWGFGGMKKCRGIGVDD